MSKTLFTYKDAKELVESALHDYEKQVDVDDLDPQEIFADGFSWAFNLDKIPSMAGMHEILMVVFDNDGVKVKEALDKIEKHFGL